MINRKLINHSELKLKSSFGNYCQQYFCGNSSSGIKSLRYQNIVGSNYKPCTHYYNPRFVYFKPTFRRSKTFFQRFFQKFLPLCMFSDVKHTIIVKCMNMLYVTFSLKKKIVFEIGMLKGLNF